jgi:Methyltransferase domain
MGEEPDDKLGHHRLRLDRIAFYGRTLGEYLLMFDINDIASLERYNTILDCPSGASSFVAEANSKYGIQAIGCDRLFDRDVETLSKWGEDDIEYVIQRVSTDPNLYKWDFYSSIEKLREYRELALQQFLLDYPTGIKEKRYIEAELPKLPFEDKSFDLVLSGHFLFTYSHKFDFSFILSSILELYRVCSREVRIYPLQKSSLQPYEQMTELLFALEKSRIKYDIVPVQFEFQRGSNKMLLLRRTDRS